MVNKMASGYTVARAHCCSTAIGKSYPISNGAAKKSNADCPGPVTGWVNKESPSGG